MAETSGTLLSSTKWTSNKPDIYVSATYETQNRTSTSVQVRVKVSISAVTGVNYFGYTIKTGVGFPNGSASVTVKNASPNQWSSPKTYDTGWVTVSQAASVESFTATVYMDSSSGTRKTSYNGTIKIKKGNTLPYWPSGTTAKLNGTTGATTVAENVTSVNYAWDAAKDDQGDTIYYRVEWFKNGINQGAWQTNATGRSFSVNPNIIGEGQNMYFRVFCRDYSTTSYPSTYKQSNTLTRNKLTAAQISSVSTIDFNSTYFNIVRTNASNLNGNGTFTYTLSSSHIPIYNGGSAGTGTTMRVDIWREGDYPAGAYVKFSEIQKYVSTSNYTGAPTFTLSTRNAYGTTLTHSKAGSVNLQVAPTKPEITAVTGSYDIKGNSYYVINQKPLTLTWTPAIDPNKPEAADVKYTVQTSTNSGAWTNEAVNLTGTTYEYPVRNISSSQSVKFRVVATTTYGTSSTGPETDEYTLHYYHPPVMSDLIIDRNADHCTMSWNYKQNSSISRVLYDTTFRVYREGREQPLHTISMGDAQSGVEQYTVSATTEGLEETDTYPLNITCYDGVSNEVFGLPPEDLQGMVPRYSALLTIREKGVGINAVAGDYAAFAAKGTTSIYGDAAKGGADGSINLATNQDASINFYSGAYLDSAGLLRAAQALPANQPVYQVQVVPENPPMRWRELRSGADTAQDAEFTPETISSWYQMGGGTLSMDSMPVGFSMDWYSDKLPSDKWLFGNTAIPAECTQARAIFGDKTPNTQGRVVVDKSTETEFNTVGKTGGAKTHTLTVAQMPAHTHTQNGHTHSFSGTTASNGGHSHTGNRLTTGVNSGSSSAVNDVVRPNGYSGTSCQVGSTVSAHTHTFSGTTGNTTAGTQNTGGGGSHNILQPYIVACKIFKIL